jgi:hypothetical protein
MSRESHSCIPGVATRNQPRTVLSPATLLYWWRGGLRCPKCDPSPNSVACYCRWRRTWFQRAQFNASTANASATRSETADTHSGALHIGVPTSLVGALPRGSSVSAAAAGVTTRRNTAAVLSEKRRRRLFQSRCLSLSVTALPRATPQLRKLSGPGPLLSRWTWARAGITSSEGGGGVLSRPPPLQPQILIPLLSQSRRRPCSLR